MAFKDSVEDYLGSTFSDTTALSRWLTDSARMMINIIPEHKLDNFTTAVTVSSSGLSLADYRISKIHKGGYESIPINIGQSASALSASSIHYAIDSSPKHYYNNGMLFIIPSGGTALAVAYPTVLYSATTISNFPKELLEAVYIQTAIRCLIYNANESIGDLQDLEYYLAVPPTAPEDETIIAAFGTLPTYTVPTVPVITYANAETRLTANDVELADSELKKIQVQLEQWSANQRDATAKFQEALTSYEGSVKRALEVAGLESKEKYELYALGLQKYATEINNYTQKFQAEAMKVTENIKSSSSQIAVLKQELKEIIDIYVNS